MQIHLLWSRLLSHLTYLDTFREINWDIFVKKKKREKIKQYNRLKKRKTFLKLKISFKWNIIFIQLTVIFLPKRAFFLSRKIVNISHISRVFIYSQLKRINVLHGIAKGEKTWQIGYKIFDSLELRMNYKLCSICCSTYFFLNTANLLWHFY